jgi:spore germination protein YaaH
MVFGMTRRGIFVALIFTIVAVLIGLGIFWWRWLLYRPDLLSPLSALTYIQSIGRPSSNVEKKVYGFLPYWTMNEATISATVTDIAYFSVGLDGAGNLLEQTNGEYEQGLRRMQQDLFADWALERQKADQKIHITITLFQADTIRALLASPTSRERAIFTISQLVASYPFSGVQLDLEYAGTVDDSLRANYVTFVKDLNESLGKQDKGIELSVAMFGSAASKYTFWDVENLAEHIDFFIVMAYDYHIRSSTVVGPVAPIFGKGTGRWENDVVSNMRDLLKVVQPDKILLGIPFYGYEWTSTSDELGAATFPQSGATATYKRVLSILEDPEIKAQERWDEDALSPYVTYKEAGQTQFIYYENTRSLSYKLDFVDQLGLRGIAIWALGYEGNREELWKTIDQKFNSNQIE